MNSTYECLTCKQCAQLLTRYEALKRDQTRIQGGLGEGASEVSEIVGRVAESRRAYTQHWATHRAVQMSCPNVADTSSCAAV
jgi:hypothetical protein